MHGGVDKSTVSRYLTIGDAFPPETAARAGVSEEDMATLSLPTLLRAARKPEAQRFTLLRDVLRKRRARAADRATRPRASRSDAGMDARPPSTDPGPEDADREATGGPGSAVHGWERYFLDRGIRVETMVPARELTAGQARAAGRRMVPALAALAARAADADRPAPLALEGSGGTVVFLPEALDAQQTAAWETFRAAIGL